MWTKITRNAFSNIGGTAISLGVGFFLMPFVVHRIGVSNFGIWMLVNSLVGYMGLLDVGLAPTLVKKAAEHLAVESAEGRQGLNRMVSTVLAIYLAIGVAVGVGIGAMTLLPGGTFKVPPQDLAVFQTILWVVGIQTALSFPMSIWIGLLSGLQDFHYMNALGILTNLLRVVFTIWLLRSGYGLLGLIWMGFGITAVGWLARWWWVRRRIPHLKISLFDFDIREAKNLIRFSGAMIIWSFAGYAVHQLDAVIIGFFLPVATIATYEIGARISDYSRNVLHSWLSIVMPAASALKAQGDVASLRSLYLKGTKYLLVSYVGVAVALLGFGREFIALWMGKEFSQAVLILDILIWGNLYQSQNLVAHVMLPGMDRLKVFTWVMLGYIFCAAGLGVLFVVRWGLPGMAAAITLTMVALESIFIVHILREFDVRLVELLRVCHLPSLIAAAPAIAWILLTRYFVHVFSWPVLIAEVGVCLALYGASFSAFGLTSIERAAVKEQIIKLLGRGIGNRRAQSVIVAGAR